MENLKKQEQYGLGQLPAMAPLSNPYVPFQLENPPQYEAAKGLVRGTLFPGLELPFMGMVNTGTPEETMKFQMQTLAFAVQELALYLDTHPNDREALEIYRKYQKLYHDGLSAYGDKYGPMSHCAPASGKEYNWLNDPWPWEYAANKEG